MSDIPKELKYLARYEYFLLLAALSVFGVNFYLEADRMKATYLVYLTQWHLIANVFCQAAVCRQVYTTIGLAEISYGVDGTAIIAEGNTSYLAALKSLKLTRLNFDPRQFALTSSVLIATLYWTLLDNGKPLELVPHGAMAVLFAAHSLNQRLPYAAKQGLWVIGLGLLYSVFNTAYAYAGGFTYDAKTGDKLDYVYPQLDWRHHPAKAAIFAMGGVFMATPLLIALISAIKNLVVPKCCSAKRAAEGTALLADASHHDDRSSWQRMWNGI